MNNSKSNSKLKQAWWVFKVLVLVTFVCSLGAISLILFGITSFLVKPFSLALYRRIITPFAALTFTLCTFITQRWSKMKILLDGDAYPKGSSSLVILNHSSRTDWYAHSQTFIYAVRKYNLTCIHI